MFQDIKKIDNFGKPDEALYLVCNTLTQQSKKIKDIEHFCLYNTNSMRINTIGVLTLLWFMSIISFTGDEVSLTKKGIFLKKYCNEKSSFTILFIRILLESILRSNDFNSILDNKRVHYNQNRDIFYVQASKIPLEFSNFRNILINIGFFELDFYSNNNLIINPCYLDYYKKSISKTRHKLTLDNLKNLLNKNEIYGKEAEVFILSYEKNRLKNHPKNGKISIISELDVGSGYDIISFNDENSLEFNRFIEVKSFSRELKFYWSANEITAAKRLNSNYYIYIVNRDKIFDDDYAPMIISNPFESIFNNDYWIKDALNWVVKPVFPLQEQ